jgi:hypothetical protein
MGLPEIDGEIDNESELDSMIVRDNSSIRSGERRRTLVAASRPGMSSVEPRRYRAGQSIEDLCRVCKMDRVHTVIVADANGQPIRTACGYCGSEHNYRGVKQPPPAPMRGVGVTSPSSASASLPAPAVPAVAADPFPLVSTRERTAPPVSADASSGSGADLELLLRRIIREEVGLTPVTPAAKWRGGQMVLRPGKADLQEKTWPIETFFHKIVMLRNRLRTLEQQINAAEMPEDAKVKLQSYITGCYGSLTSFNILFADEDDQFKGSGGE